MIGETIIFYAVSLVGCCIVPFFGLLYSKKGFPA